MRIALISIKGGSAKTTSAMNLAQALTSYGTVELLDTDPQGSATDWAYRAEDGGETLDFTVTPSNTQALRRLDKSQVTDHVVIDTPPGLPDVILASARVADAVIIPTEHSGLDMTQVWKIIDTLPEVPFAVLITKSNPRTRSFRSAVEEMQQNRVPLFVTDIRRGEPVKAAFGHALSSDRLFGYDAVLDELLAALDAPLARVNAKEPR